MLLSTFGKLSSHRSALSLIRSLSTSFPLFSSHPDMDITKDYYGVLGVTPDATLTEIREAFYDSARKVSTITCVCNLVRCGSLWEQELS